MNRQTSAKKLAKTPKDLLNAVRSLDNLYRAWVAVRSNINASKHKNTKTKKAGVSDSSFSKGASEAYKQRQALYARVEQISENPYPYLRALQAKLHKDTFVFAAQVGVPLKSKTDPKKRRPIVVSPLDNRIVQRAILNVLQENEDPKIVKQLGIIPKVIRTSTSVGGVPDGGREKAVNLVTSAIADGRMFVMRSDIKKFFTRIPKPIVISFLQDHTGQKGFCDLFERALKTELENEEEIKEFVHLFPSDDVGVPQGSSLSALAGNIVLKDFDCALNNQYITTVRYIDDFIILGKSQKAVLKGIEIAKEELKKLGMEAYGPTEDPKKSSLGTVSGGFSFLGCEFRNGISPSREACQSIFDDIQDDLKGMLIATQERIKSGTPRRAQMGYYQCLAKIDRKVRGWGDSYVFCSNRLPFIQLDRKIDELLEIYGKRFYSLLEKKDVKAKRRALGIAVLEDGRHPTKDILKK